MQKIVQIITLWEEHMNIKDYYKNYATNKYSKKLSTGYANTIDDLYKNCIQDTLLDVKDVLAWHNMLMEYVDLTDAIFWVRYYESGSRNKITNRFNNRRACLTRFNDGFSYVFVSNYDAHEIFNMIAHHVIPTANEFLNLMK